MTAVVVLVLSNSGAVRDELVRGLSTPTEVDVRAAAATEDGVVEVVRRQRPDVVVLDLDGPDAVLLVEQMMGHVPTPIVVLAATADQSVRGAAVQALVAGAVVALPRPRGVAGAEMANLRAQVRELRGMTVLRHSRAHLRHPPRVQPRITHRVVGLAASTGGPGALAIVLAGLGGLEAPVLVVQHLHPDFIDGFVKHLARSSALPVCVARDGVRAEPGVVAVGPPDVHLRIAPGAMLRLDPEPRRLHRPSADELFGSMARLDPGGAIGVLMTGMGDDGATGLLAMRRAGAHTIAQDEATSAVYGMPRAAAQNGAAVQVLPLDAIAPAVLRFARRAVH